MSHSTSVPFSPRIGLAIAAAVTGLTLAGGVTLATSLGWLRPPAAQASSSSASVPAGTVTTGAPLQALPGGSPDSPAGVDPSQATPLTHVDEAGNLWAWYGSGDWVLAAPAPAGPTPVLAAGREQRTERDEHAYQRTAERSTQGTGQRSTFAGRESHNDD